MASEFWILLVPFVIFAFAVNSFAGEPRRVEWANLAAHLAEESAALLELNVLDCPEDIQGFERSRSVAQFIENTFYLWEEYDVVTDGDATGLFIVMKKPESASLSAEEAQVLLTASSRWTESQPRPQDTVVLDASDPRLDRESIDSLLDDGQTLRPQDVIGDDDRTRITDTTSFPWNTHCYVEMTFPSPLDGMFGRGTGCLVGPNMLLTCGHCVYDRPTGVFTDHFVIAPGQSQDSEHGPVTRPYGTTVAVEVRTDPRYHMASDGEQWAYDYGAALFNTPFSGIDTYMPVEFSENLSIGDTLHTAGYPPEVHAETDSQALWEASGLIVAPQPDQLVWYTIDTTGGQSGSPVRKKNPDRIVGVLAAGSQIKNAGPRLTAHNQALITEWMQWAPSELLSPPVLDAEPAETSGLSNTISWAQAGSGGAVGEYINDVRMELTDDGTTISTINIPDNGTINDLDVKVNISHTWNSDLDVYLIAPDDTRVELFTDIGGKSDDFINTVFDDQAPSSIRNGSAPFTGSYRPEGSLADLTGKDIKGRWKLEVTDDSAGDLGTLKSWSLIVDGGNAAGSADAAYYAECATGANFGSVVADSGWITDLNCTFTELIRNQEYWYRVKARPLATWSQTSQFDFQIDVLTGTEATDVGDVVLPSGGGGGQGPELHVIENPSFELDGGWGGGGNNPILVFLATGYWPNILWSSDGVWVAGMVFDPDFFFSNGDYSFIMQANIDWTGVETLVFDYCSFWGSELESTVFIGNQEVWSHTHSHTFQDAHNDIARDVSHISGRQDLKLRVDVKTSGWINAAIFWDNLRTYGAAGSARSGSIVSSPIRLDDGDTWDTLAFDATVPAATTLTVDVLPETGEIPIPGYDDVVAGTDLSGLAARTIRLRANLGASDAAATPMLHDWSVSYTEAFCESEWSNVESSVQSQ